MQMKGDNYILVAMNFLSSVFLAGDFFPVNTFSILKCCRDATGKVTSITAELNLENTVSKVEFWRRKVDA